MRFRLRTLMIVFLLLALSAPWWVGAWRDPELVVKLRHLHGKPLEAVIASLGKPDRQTEFIMAECVGELRTELFNTYPPDDPKVQQVLIKEWQWDRVGYHTALWMHQVNGEWVVLDTCRWKDGVAF